MAPYISHLVVAEQVHAQFWTRDDHLGEYLYGSIIPDVSAEPNTLTRLDTHFVGSYGAGIRRLGGFHEHGSD